LNTNRLHVVKRQRGEEGRWGKGEKDALFSGGGGKKKKNEESVPTSRRVRRGDPSPNRKPEVTGGKKKKKKKRGESRRSSTESLPIRRGKEKPVFARGRKGGEKEDPPQS